MFKRFFWLSVGVVTGSWLTLRFKRRVQETVERVLPERVASDVTARARLLAANVRDAAREGRAVMKEREAALRSELIDK